MSIKSCLENFPDELFLDIFSYISPNELYHVWYGLNKRLASIIHSVQINFDLVEYSDKTIRALDHFSKQILYLHLHVSNKSLNLKQFSNLRSLVINTQLTDEQIHSIKPIYFQKLRRLQFLQWNYRNESVNHIIFSQKIRTWLKVYHLPSVPRYFFDNNLNLCHIQTMIFDRITTDDMHLILSLQKTICRLKVTLVHWTNNIQISKIVYENKNYQHQHLIQLDITLNACNKLDELYPLLSHLPRLRYLYIACDSLTINDFKQLSVELNTRVPWLERLNCTFKQTYIENMDELHQMNVLFQRMKCKKIEWAGGWYYYCITTENG